MASSVRLRRLWPAPALLAALLVAGAGVAAWAGAAAGAGTAAPLSISIVGNHFVNGSGQTIRLLGVNHSSAEYACAEGYAYDDGHLDAADAAAIASWHANAVRIPLNEDCWLGINGQPNNSQSPGQTFTATGYRQEIENYVADLNAQGIYAILDLHWSAPGSQVALEQQPMPDADHSADFWSSVATNFRSDPAVVFDVFNEPYDPTDPRSGADQNANDAVTWNCWETGTENGPEGGSACDTEAYDTNGNPTTRYQVAGLQSLVDAIRATGATQPVMTGGLNYANDLTQWLDHAPDDPLNQEAASFHNYQGAGKCDTAACWNAQIAPVAAHVPVVTGEFAEDDFDEIRCSEAPTTFDDDYMNWADQNGVSYLAWSWNVLSSSEQDDGGCSAYFLINDFNGTPAAPNGVALHAHLAALAAAGSATTTTPTGGGTTNAPTPTTTAPPTTSTTTTTSTAPKTTTTTPTTPTGGSQAIRLRSLTARLAAGDRSIRVTLTATQRTTATVALRTAGVYRRPGRSHRGHVAIGRTRITLRPGRASVLTLDLSGASRRLIAAHPSIRLQATVTFPGTGTAKATVVRRTFRLLDR